jgi:hypothetical protein
VAAPKKLQARNSREAFTWAGKKGIEWHLVPTGGQHFIRQAERVVGILKKQMQKSLETKRFSHEEICMLP